MRILVIAMMSFMLLFSGCSSSSEIREIESLIGLNLPEGSVIASRDTYGFDGAGHYIAKVSLPINDADDVMASIKQSGWSPLPLREDIYRVLYSGGFDKDSEPSCAQEAGIPKVQNGFWFFEDRSTLKDEKLQERSALGITLAIYNTETNVLYVYMSD